MINKNKVSKILTPKQKVKRNFGFISIIENNILNECL